MLNRSLLVSLLAAFTLPASATDYSDMWYLPAESGWGVNLTQNDNALFMTFFVYGTDNKPTWYVAVAYRDGNGNFAGSLYSTVGSYFGAPWNPSDHPPATLVGTASFVPASPYAGTLTYTLINGPTVVKSIERQTLTTIALGANYAGGQTGSYTSCSDNTQNGAYRDTYDLSVTHANGNATFIFTYDSGATCTMAGTLVQSGQLYRIASASYSCTGSLVFNTSATIEEIKATAQGIEGRFSASYSDGCQENARFSAALY